MNRISVNTELLSALVAHHDRTTFQLCIGCGKHELQENMELCRVCGSFFHGHVTPAGDAPTGSYDGELQTLPCSWKCRCESVAVGSEQDQTVAV